MCKILTINIIIHIYSQFITVLSKIIVLFIINYIVFQIFQIMIKFILVKL
jgi:hypothetical protein